MGRQSLPAQQTAEPQTVTGRSKGNLGEHSETRQVGARRLR